MKKIFLELKGNTVRDYVDAIDEMLKYGIIDKDQRSTIVYRLNKRYDEVQN